NINIGDKLPFLDNLFYSAFIQDDQLQSKEIAKEINICISSLPQRCKEVFLLSRYDNFKNKEIAAHLNISIKTVEKHITKALQEIRIHLLQAGYLLIWFFIWIGSPPPLTLFNHRDTQKNLLLQS
ncbi:MAG: sigma-70 family RNA polymerase sigma factor, partial [Bacteroidia bacterium]|nr:sigma-70 family RNA polymerase sigma factor [Bacteroidia bacterium]